MWPLVQFFQKTNGRLSIQVNKAEVELQICDTTPAPILAFAKSFRKLEVQSGQIISLARYKQNKSDFSLPGRDMQYLGS